MIRKAKHLSILWSRSALLSLQESNYRHRRAEPKRLKFPCYLFELARIFIFCGQRFSHAPHSLHKLAKWWLGRKPAVVFIYWLFPVFSGWRPHCMPQNKRGYPPHRGRACNSRRPCRESGKRNETPCYALIYRLFFRPNEPGSASPATFTFSASCSRVLIPLSTTVTSG